MSESNQSGAAKRPWYRWLLWPLALLGLLIIALILLYFWSVRAPAELAGQFEQRSVVIGGHARTYSFFRPDNAPARPALLFLLHGSGGDGGQMRSLFTAYRFDLLARQHGFITVYPDGYRRYWNDCRASAAYAANTENIDDTAFFRGMIDTFVREQGADPARVYAMGISNGGQMIYRLGYELPEAFAGLAAVAANLPVPANNDCRRSGRPVSMAILNGTEDPINPYDGGLVVIGNDSSRGEVLSSADSIAYWADLATAVADGEAVALPERDGDETTRIEMQRWRGAEGIDVRLYKLQGSGHVLPIAEPNLLQRLLTGLIGGNAGDIDGAGELFEFFNGKTRSVSAD